MNDIDQIIRDTLSEEDAKWFDELNEQSMAELIVAAFRGKMRWLVAMGYLATLAFLLLAAVAAVQFFRAASTQAMVGWAVGFGLCLSAIGMMKIWYWMELNRIAVMREMKRFELQLARLCSRRSRP
jgi:hypothetical protein